MRYDSFHPDVSIGVGRQASGAEQELPLTPQMRARLLAGASWRDQWIAGTGACGAALILLAWSGAGRWVLQSPPRIAVVSLCLVALAIAPSILDNRRAWRDLRANRFIRYRGRFALRRYSQPSRAQPYWNIVRERKVVWAVAMPSAEIVVTDVVADLMRKAGSGEIDYSPRRKMIFEIRDSDGGIVFQNSRAR